MVDEDMTLDALSVVKSLPDFQETITGVIPQFGGKCFDITLNNAESALQLAEAGFDYGDLRKPLRLLGPKVYPCVDFCVRGVPGRRITKNIERSRAAEIGCASSAVFYRGGIPPHRARHTRGGIRFDHQGSPSKGRYSGIGNFLQIFWPTYHVLSVPFSRARGKGLSETAPRETLHVPHD